MSRFIDIILGKPPIAGIEYTLGGKYPRILKPEDINNGIVRMRYPNSNTMYMSYHAFNFSWKPSKAVSKRDRWEGKY